MIPQIRKQAIGIFIAGLGSAIIAELVRFIAQLKDNSKDATRYVGLSVNAFSEVFACCILVSSLLLINKEIAKRFQDIVDMRSLTILCVSYCLFVAATILEDVSTSTLDVEFNYIVLLSSLLLYTIS